MKHETAGTCDQACRLGVTVDTLALKVKVKRLYVVELKCIVYTAGR